MLGAEIERKEERRVGCIEVIMDYTKNKIGELRSINVNNTTVGV